MPAPPDKYRPPELKKKKIYKFINSQSAIEYSDAPLPFLPLAHNALSCVVASGGARLYLPMRRRQFGASKKEFLSLSLTLRKVYISIGEERIHSRGAAPII